jgi:DNA-binding PadR family transcriptional regulator
MDYLGEFELLVMLAVLRLGANAYGMTIRREIEDVGERSASLGAVYTTLERLEDKGFVSSAVGERTEERGGRAKKYFKITASGSSAMKRSLESTEAMKKGLSPGWVGNKMATEVEEKRTVSSHQSATATTEVLQRR